MECGRITAESYEPKLEEKQVQKLFPIESSGWFGQSLDDPRHLSFAGGGYSGGLRPDASVWVCQFRRRRVRVRKPRCYRRPDFQRHRAGIHSWECRKLGSADDDFTHAGLPVVRAECQRTSFDECAAARDDGDSAVFGIAADDRRPVAERLRGGGVCHSSAAGGIGGVGDGTQGRVERVVFHADTLGICALCAPTAIAGSLLDGDVVLGLGPDVQGDAGDTAVGIVAAGLLAAESVRPAGVCRVEKSFPSAASDPRKDSPAGAFPCVMRGGAFGPGSCGSALGEIPPFLANRQRAGFLCYLWVADVLPGEAGGLLSLSGQRSAAGGSCSGVLDIAGHLGGSLPLAAALSLSFGRLAVVSGDADTGDRAGSNSRAGKGGSLHLPAADRPIPGFDLGGNELVCWLALSPAGVGRHGGRGGGSLECGFIRPDFLLARQ